MDFGFVILIPDDDDDDNRRCVNAEILSRHLSMDFDQISASVSTAICSLGSVFSLCPQCYSYYQPALQKLNEAPEECAFYCNGS